MQRMLLTLLTFGIVYGQIDYGTQVQTIFDNNCTGCHGYSGGLNLTDYDGLMSGGNSGDVIVPEDHANSILWQEIESGDMPPSGNLTSDEINLIATWIDEGASETPQVDVTGLFFSEYGEGSGNNKYLEIYNGTGSEVDLTGFAFPNTSNGVTNSGEYEFWNTFPAGATVAAGDVYVIAHTAPDEEFPSDEADYTFQYLSNGNDGFCLVEGTEGSFTILDCIGDWSGDYPENGQGWSVAGVELGTVDHTLVRQSTVTDGNSGDWNSSAGTNAGNSEWIVLEQNTWSYIGSHPHEITTDGPSIAIVSPENGSTISASQVTVEFSVGNFSVGSAGDGVDGHVHYQLDGGNAVMHLQKKLKH